MKKAINQWLFVDTMTIEECMVLAKDAGFDGIELCLGENRLPSEKQGQPTLDEEAGISGYRNIELALDTPREEVERIGELASKIGIEICSIATTLNFHYPLTSPDAKTRGKGIKVMTKVLEDASLVGAKIVILIPGIVTDEVSYTDAYERSQKAIKELVGVAERFGIYMGLENVWNKFLLSPLEFSDFIDRMNSRYVCAYFDVGNIMAYGYPEQWIRILGKRIKNVHLKDFKLSVGNINGFTNLLQGDVPWPKVMNALMEIGYDGYLTVESIPAYKFYPEALIYEASLVLDKLLKR